MNVQNIMCKLCAVRVGHDTTRSQKMYSIIQQSKTENHLKSVNLYKIKKQIVYLFSVS